MSDDGTERYLVQMVPHEPDPEAARPSSVEATVLKSLRVYVDAIDAQLKLAGF